MKHLFVKSQTIKRFSLLWILSGVLGLSLFVRADVATGAGTVVPPSAPMAPAIKPAAKALPAKLYYLTGGEDVFVSFPACPELGSDRDHTDLLLTLVVQSSRNSGQIAEARNDANYDDAILAMECLVDPAFQTIYPSSSKVAQLLAHAGDDGYFITSRLKKKNVRLRPYLQHPGLVVPLFPASDFSYPSAHASGSELQARILAVLFPDKTDVVLNKARLIAESRVVAGVHYESDIEAGRYLGDLIFTELSDSFKFKMDLAAAKKELKEPAARL